MLRLFHPPVPQHSADPVTNHARMIRALADAEERDGYKRALARAYTVLRRYAHDGVRVAIDAKYAER